MTDEAKVKRYKEYLEELSDDDLEDEIFSIEQVLDGNLRETSVRGISKERFSKSESLVKFTLPKHSIAWDEMIYRRKRYITGGIV